MKTEGTPTTLGEVADNIMWEIMVCPMDKLKERLQPIMHKHLRDYLAQKFGQAILRATPESQKELGQLWFVLTGETKLLGDNDDKA